MANPTFYDKFWETVKTLTPTFFTQLNKLWLNIDYLNKTTPDVAISNTQSPTVSNKSRHNERSKITTIFKKILTSTSDTVLDDSFDYHRRVIHIRGFIREQEAGVDLRPNGAEDHYLGRFAHPWYQHSFDYLDGYIQTTLDFRDENNSPTVYRVHPESRVHATFFSADGLANAPRRYDPFSFSVPLAFVRLCSEDSHFPGVRNVTGTFPNPPDIQAFEEFGSFVFLWVRETDGAFMGSLLPRLLNNMTLHEEPRDYQDGDALFDNTADTDMVIALNIFAGPKWEKE